MARNWDTAGAGGLGTLIDAYYSGADRKRNIAKEKADSQRGGQEWAFTNTKNYRKPVMDENGFVTGYETNQDTRSRNQPVLKNLKPEYFRDPPSAAPAPVAAAAPAQAPKPQLSPEEETRAMNETPEADANRKRMRAEMITRMKASGQLPQDYVEPNREPQGLERVSNDPKPLIRDPKAAQLDAQIQSNERQNMANNETRGRIEEKRLQSGKRAMVGAGTKSVEYDKNDPGQPGVDAQGKPVRVVNARRTTMQPFEGTDIPVDPGQNAAGSGSIPGEQAQAQPEQDPGEYDPDDYMMGRITDLATTPSSRALDQMISVGSMPPELLRGTGLEGFRGQLPVSVFRDILSGKTKLDIAGMKQQGKTVDEYDTNVLGPVADNIRKGTSLGAALEEFQIIAGRPPSKREEKILTTVSQAFEAGERAKGLTKVPPGGYRFTDDGQNLEAIPGGPAAGKAAEGAAKKGKAEKLAERTAAVVTQDVGRIFDILKKNPRGAVGPIAGQKRIIPGTDAYRIDKMLGSIRANISMDKLQAMREASPTGGALGQVSDFENRMLQATMGNIEVATNAEDFKYNLRRLADQYNDVVHGPGGAAPKGDAGGGDLDAKAKEAMRLIDESGANASKKRIAKQKVLNKLKELKAKGANNGSGAQ